MAPAARYDGNPAALARFRADPAEPPSHAVWEITLRCDLGCRHCGSRAGRARRDELTTTEALDLVEQLADLGLKEVSLIGGEFYLREDWDTIAAAIVRRGMLCSVVTGARQMTETRVARAVAAGIGKISLSIDGLERTHDAIRGSTGSFRAAVAAAHRISGAGIDLSVNTQMNRLTMPELPAVADLLGEIGARSWMVILTAPLGRAADRPSLHLQPYHLLYLFPLLATIKQEKLDPNGIAFFPANNVGYFGPLAETLRYGSGTFDGCGAGISTLGIEADGRLKGCPSLPTTPYVRGSIRERPLADIAADLVRERTTQPTPLWGLCASCPFAARCRGGCTWTAHVLFGRPGNNPYCHSRALTLAGEGKVETLQRVEAAPGAPFDYGRYEIVEAPLASIEADPLIGVTMASKVFGLKRDLAGLWSADELAAALAVS
jgi:radical SAM protein with 4Fe4S-binding SPASM domain